MCKNSDQSRWIGSNQESSSSVTIKSTGAAITLNADKSLPSFLQSLRIFREGRGNVEAVIANTFRDTQSLEKLRGRQVAIAVGSRGINQLSRIVLAVVNEIKNWCGSGHCSCHG